MALTLLIGGARSGKSTLAVRMAGTRTAPVVFIATARLDDDDMRRRAERHRAERPPGWTTVEEPLDLAGCLRRAAREDVLVADCLTLWVSNMMLEGLDDAVIEERARTAASAAARRDGDTIVVTNEVGAGVHPETELGRRFRDTLGRVNAIWASVADRALLVVAGRVLRLEDVDVAEETGAP